MRLGPTTEETSARMKTVRRRDTPKESGLRKRLWALGLRYRVDHRLPTLRRRADIVFVSAKVAVFVDGCFWHVCPVHATWPVRNGEWWRDKLLANERRDRETDAALNERGWTVVRVWEHEGTDEAVTAVLAALSFRSAALKRA